MLAGLQGAGKTTLAGKLSLWLRNQGHAPLLVACDLQRPNAVTQLQVVGEQAGVSVFAPEPGNGVGNPVGGGQGRHRVRQRQAARHRHRRHRRPARRRRRADAAGRGHPRRGRSERDPVRARRDDRPGRGDHRPGLRRRCRLHRRGADQARRRRPRWCCAQRPADHRRAHHVRLHRRETGRLRHLPPGPDGLADPGHGRHAHPDRAGRAALRGRPGRGDGRQAGRATTSPSTTSCSR